MPIQAATHNGMKQAPFRSDLPFRLDRLPWARWHWLVVLALGITWILDGLQVTVVGLISSRLQDKDALGLTTTQAADSAVAYLIGAVSGSLIFGYLADRFGRKRLFMVTLVWYITGIVLAAFSFNFYSFAFCELIAGMGIGGGYSAINSAIDELIPSKYRGAVDLTINGSWWIGTIIGSVESIFLLNPHVVDQSIGWRLTFGLGAVLSLAILLVRRYVPESPRWLLSRGKVAEAEAIVSSVERGIESETGKPLPPVSRAIMIDPNHRTTLGSVVHTMLAKYPRRTFVSLALMCTQAFLYNAIFFTEALVLTTFFGVQKQDVGYYIFPFAVGNFLGPLLLGRLFDTLGRRFMIGATYITSGVLLLLTGLLFTHHLLSATTITAAWSVIFFFASAGASAAYLTASEIFPLETRAIAIAVVYSVGTLVGGPVATHLFGALIETKSADNVFIGYVIGTVAMIAGGLVAAIWGIDAERKMLEDIAPPLGVLEEASVIAESMAYTTPTAAT
jgi:MFS family permease